MAAYQGEKMGKYVRNTEAKIRRCQKKEIVMKDEIADISKRTSELQLLKWEVDGKECYRIKGKVLKRNKLK